MSDKWRILSDEKYWSKQALNHSIINEKKKKKNQNEEIILNILVSHINEKMRKGYLRWFDSIQKKIINGPVRGVKWFKVRKLKKVKKAYNNINKIYIN